MITPSPNFVSTDLGRLHVRRTGTGPPVVLWHSLFVDSTVLGHRWSRRFLATGPSTPSMAHPTAERARAPRLQLRGVRRRRGAGPRPPRPRPNRSTGSVTRGEAMSAFTLRAAGLPVADTDHNRHPGPGVHAAGEADQGLAAGRSSTGSQARTASSRSSSPIRCLEPNRIAAQPDQAARSWRRSPTPTATACCMPCGR